MVFFGGDDHLRDLSCFHVVSSLAHVKQIDLSLGTVGFFRSTYGPLAWPFCFYRWPTTKRLKVNPFRKTK